MLAHVNACDFEMAALLNPVYDIQRLGFDFVASPRHADIVLVTGAVTRNMELAVRRTYDAMPHPKIVIACGACACNKGAVGDGYAVVGKVADILPVAIELPGCPPRPQDILQALLAAREIYRTF
jgi:Ni,Fe-hydrogenase III small subunit